MALIVSRVVRPGSKLSTADLVGRHHPGGRSGRGRRVHRRGLRRDGLAGWAARTRSRPSSPARHLAAAVNPARMALFDLSSSWVEGACCELAARGYSRDGKKGSAQIEYGLLTDPAGRPVAIRVFPGNTADPTAFTEVVATVRDKFGLAQLVLVGDRGMITSARIEALRADTRTPTWAGSPRCAHPRSPARRRRRAAADDPVRPARPGRDQPPRLPRRTADRLPQPRPGRRTRPQTRRAAGRHRDTCSPPSSPRSPPAGWPARTGSGSRSARSSTSTRWPSTSTSPSPTPASPSPAEPGQHRRRGRPRRHLRAAHQRARRRPRRRRRGRPPTRTSPTSNATSASSRSTTWTCAPSTTASTTGSAPTCCICHARRLPDLAPAHSPGPADLHRRTPTRTATTPSPPRNVRRSRPARPPPQHDADDNPLRTFRGLLDHLATLTRNDVRSPRRQHRPCPSSPNPPPTNAAPSN